MGGFSVIEVMLLIVSLSVCVVPACLGWFKPSGFRVLFDAG